MQANSGIRGLLAISWIYDLFQNLVGQPYSRRWLAKNYWRLNGGEKIVDIGCGPGVILDYIPKSVEYVGFDMSEDYVKSARKKYSQRGTFIIGTVRGFLDKPDARLLNSDLVLCNGILHHLDDVEAKEVLQLSKEIMPTNGRLVCVEPVYLVHQPRISKWIMSQDRGKNIRTEDEWESLVSSIFDNFKTNIAASLIRIPYTFIIIEGFRTNQRHGRSKSNNDRFSRE